MNSVGKVLKLSDKRLRPTVKFYVQTGQPVKHHPIGTITAGLEAALLRSYNNDPLHKFTYVPTNNIREADVVIFSGGPDISPKLYGEAAIPGTNFVAERDVNDVWAYHWSKDKIKLGICRGAQLLNVMSGGRLWQDVDGHRTDHLVEARIPNVAELNKPAKVEAWATSKTFLVTSTHHQMMRMGPEAVLLGHSIPRHETYRGSICTYKKSGGKYSALSVIGAATTLKIPQQRWENEWLDDDLVDPEMVWYPNTLSLCVQGHPEYGVATPAFKSYVGNLLQLVIEQKRAA